MEYWRAPARHGEAIHILDILTHIALARSPPFVVVGALRIRLRVAALPSRQYEWRRPPGGELRQSWGEGAEWVDNRLDLP